MAVRTPAEKPKRPRLLRTQGREQIRFDTPPILSPRIRDYMHRNMKLAPVIVFVLVAVVVAFGPQSPNMPVADGLDFHAAGSMQPQLVRAGSVHKPGCKRSMHSVAQIACGSGVALSAFESFPLPGNGVEREPVPTISVPKPFHPTGLLDPPRFT